MNLPDNLIVVSDIFVTGPTGQPRLFGDKGTLSTAAFNEPVFFTAEEKNSVATDPTDATVHTVIIMPPFKTFTHIPEVNICSYKLINIGENKCMNMGI